MNVFDGETLAEYENTDRVGHEICVSAETFDHGILGPWRDVWLSVNNAVLDEHGEVDGQPVHDPGAGTRLGCVAAARRRSLRRQDHPVTAPATANEVVRHLAELTRELREKTSAYRSAEMDAALKRHGADMCEARAFLSTDGAVEFRKNTARVAADQLEGGALVAEALVRVLKAEIRSIETRIEVGRTYGATVRAELKTLGMDGAA